MFPIALFFLILTMRATRRRGTFRWKRKKEQTLQARIHTGFHRFTEIGQIFDKKYIFQ